MTDRTEVIIDSDLPHGTRVSEPEPEPAKRVPNRRMRRDSGWRKTAKHGYRKRHAAQENYDKPPWRH